VWKYVVQRLDPACTACSVVVFVAVCADQALAFVVTLSRALLNSIGHVVKVLGWGCRAGCFFMP
jgi:hypothetical protein